MAIFDFFKSSSSSAQNGDVSDSMESRPDDRDERKTSIVETNNALVTGSEEDDSSLKQDGVKKAQATTIVWSRKAIILAYALIFLIFFVDSFGQQISFSLLPYVTSSFYQHSLVATTQVVYLLVSGVIKLPLAKFMDIVGRPQGYVLMLVCAVIGLAMMAATNGVTMYAAAQVFYWVGQNGIAYVLDVFIADTSSLKWRGLMIAFSTSPYIATVFAGPAAGEAYYNHSTWRWAYGTFAILTPVISLPFLWIFWYNQKLARKQGVLVEKREASGRTWSESVQHYLIEFDVIGIILIVAGWSLILLPFSLATSVASQWRSPSIIAMLVIGFCCLVAFFVHERFFAKKTFLPFHLLTDRTVIGSCLTATSLFISFYCWNLYFTSFLQVVFDLSIADAGYVAQIYNIGSCFWSIVVGLLIPATGRFKWLAICAVPLQILGTGLMIYFRQPGQALGYVIMCQIFIAFSGGTIVVTQQIAIMAAVGPENVAVGLALQSLFTSIGGGIGASVAGAIWTNTLPGELEKYLPDNLQSQLADIYGDLTTQLSFPVGSPGRDAIVRAYGETQRYMCIAATVVLIVMLVAVFMWRDYRVNEFKQPRGAKVV